MKTKHILAMGLSFCFFNTFAQVNQPDSLVIDQIDIVKKYQYAIKKVKKLDVQPQFLDSNFITSSFTYELPLVGNRESAPITTSVNDSFFNLESDSSKAPLYSNYLIGAFSTKANPFAELSFSEELDNFKFGIFGQYHADNQTNNEDPFFGFEHARLDGYLDYLKKNLLFQSEIGFQNQEERLVQEVLGGRFDFDPISYQKYNAKVGVENLSTSSFLKHVSLEYKGLQEKNNNSENYIHIGAGISDYLAQESLLWRVNANYHLSVNEMDNNDLDNNLGLLDLTPQLQGDYDKLYYTVGLNTIIAWDDNHLGKNGTTYLIPDISLTYRFDKSFNLNTGFKADYELYNYINIQNINPYLTETGLNTKTRVSKLIYANLDGIISGIKYQLGGQYSIGGNRLFYQTKFNNHVYEAYYETGDYMALTLNLDYQYTKQIALQLFARAQQFTLDSKSKASHTPAFETHIKTIYQVNEQLAAYGTLNFASKQYMLSNTNFADPDVRSIQKTINPRFDLSVGAHYDIKRQWRLFAEVNNVFNNKYERWGSYLHKGVFFTGGFRFKF